MGIQENRNTHVLARSLGDVVSNMSHSLEEKQTRSRWFSPLPYTKNKVQFSDNARKLGFLIRLKMALRRPSSYTFFFSNCTMGAHTVQDRRRLEPRPCGYLRAA